MIDYKDALNETFNCLLRKKDFRGRLDDQLIDALKSQLRVGLWDKTESRLRNSILDSFGRCLKDSLKVELNNE